MQDTSCMAGQTGKELNMNAHDLIKEAIAEKGKFDSVYWDATACP